MWEELVRERGGVGAGSLADFPDRDLGAARFVAVLCRDEGILPAVAALGPAQAAAYLLLVDEQAGSDRAGAANELLEKLAATGRAAYLLKSGRVGGTAPEHSIEIRSDHAAAIVDAIAAGTIEWEEDPDFSYRVAARVPGIEGWERYVLIPRFLYARTDRVYEYAATVPRLKRERAERLSALGGLDPAIIEALR